MRMASCWDGSDGLPAEVSSKAMGVNRKKSSWTPVEKWAIRRRGAWVLQQQGFTYREIAVVMESHPAAVEKLLYRTRQMAQEVLTDAG